MKQVFVNCSFLQSLKINTNKTSRAHLLCTKIHTINGQCQILKSDLSVILIPCYISRQNSLSTVNKQIIEINVSLQTTVTL